MALETASTIDDLVSTNPTSGDPKAQGDDHLRLLKAVLKADFTPYTHGTTGSIALPDGLLVKWGSVTTSASATKAVTFASAFSSAVYQVFVSASSSGAARMATYNSATTTGVNVDMWNTSGSRVAESVSWLAIGK